MGVVLAGNVEGARLELFDNQRKPECRFALVMRGAQCGRGRPFRLWEIHADPLLQPAPATARRDRPQPLHGAGRHAI